MDILELWETIEDSLELFGKGVLCKLDLSKVEGCGFPILC